MPVGDRYAANVAFLGEKYPDLARRLTGDTGPIRPIFTDGVPTDIQIVDQRLYNGDARDIVVTQVQSFLAKPARVGYDANSFSSDSLVSRASYINLRRAMATHSLDVIPAAPVVRSGFMLIFGIGLGYHLKSLIEAVDVEHVVIAEVVGEFLDMSCHAIDWQEIHQLCEARKTTLHVFVAEQPGRLAGEIGALITEVGTVLLDGVYCFRHYPLWALDEAYRRTVNEFPRHIMARGYYEDERKMIRNAITNLHKCDYYLVEGSFRPRTDVPAFIIASGPSVDEAIATVKEWRDHAVVFSCGSSLQICLKHGIIPDYHVELENVVAVKDFLDHILEKNRHLFPGDKFDGIKLISSVTVNPRVMAFFDEAYFFFRDSSVSTKCLAEGIPIMSAVGPNVSNTAVAVAARLGFGEMYFFGFDCGWRDAKTHHSKDTAYYTAEKHKVEEAKATITVPGNFGGEVETDTTLDWSRDMIEQKLRGFSIKAFNCSDGALIEGALPLVPEGLALKGPVLDRAAILASIRDNSRLFKAGEFLQRFDMADFVAEVDAFSEAILALIDRAKAEKMSFMAFHGLVWPLVRDLHKSPDYRHIGSMFACSTMAMMKLACFFLNRVEDPATREAVTLQFYDDFKALHEEMLVDGRQVMEEARIMVEGGPEPEWTKGLQTVEGTTY
ncbi:MAG: motility associated factor glycosyltransferase family protein [Alphaproteobacteria bacterium]|nr:motility associated factor glycosyltransferase family protein [Alphaproteobacteria bacterium]